MVGEIGSMWINVQRKTFAICALIAGTIGVAACNNYVSPALPPNSATTVSGFRVNGSDVTKTQLMYVDGQDIDWRASNGNDPIALAPGTHQIKTLIRHVQDKKPYSGWVSINITSETGKNYIVRMSEPTMVGQNCAKTSVWVETQDGTIVGDTIPVILPQMFVGMEFMTGGTFVSVPGHSAACPST